MRKYFYPSLKNRKSLMYFRYACFSIVIALGWISIIASGGGDGDNKDTNGGASNSNLITIQGFIQKGPFIQGSEVYIQELATNLAPTGDVFITETSDDAGAFNLEADIDGAYLDIKTTGFYFNEVTGKLSNASITLNAIVDVSESNDINVNILTTLSYERIKYLIQNEGMSHLEAQEQAEDEVLNIFNIDQDILETEVSDFYNMDISKEGISNAILLAVSSILQWENTEAELSELAAKISSDMKTDGSLDNPIYIEEIKGNSINLQPSVIRQNIINRYESLGLSISVSNFEDFVDSDYENPWTYKKDMPVACGDMGAANLNGRIYIIGGLSGFSDSGNLNQTIAYDPSTDTWETYSSMNTRRFLLTASAVNEKIYAIGGSNVLNGSRDVLNAVEEYDPASNTWTARAPMPTAREGLASGVVNDRIYVIGGKAFDSIFNVVEEYDPASNTWTARAPMPTARCFISAAVVNGKIYVMGGSTDPVFFNHSNILEEYDPSTDTWTARAPMPSARSFLGAAVVNGKIYAVGGDGGNTSVEEYDPTTNTWTIKSPMPEGRNDFAAVSENNKIYVIGALFLSTVMEYDPAIDLAR